MGLSKIYVAKRLTQLTPVTRVAAARGVRLPQLCHKVSNRCGNRVLSGAFVVDALARALSRLKTDRDSACLLSLQNFASNNLRCVRLRSNGLTQIHTCTYSRGG